MRRILLIALCIGLQTHNSIARDLYFKILSENGVTNAPVYGFWMDLPEQDMPANGESYWMQPFDFGNGKMVDSVISAYGQNPDECTQSWSPNALMVLAKCYWETGEISSAAAKMSQVCQKVEKNTADMLLWLSKTQLAFDTTAGEAGKEYIAGLLSRCETNAPVSSHYDQFWQWCRLGQWKEAAPHFEWLVAHSETIPDKFWGLLEWFATTKGGFYRRSEVLDRLIASKIMVCRAVPDFEKDIEAGSVQSTGSAQDEGKPFFHTIYLDVGCPVRHRFRPVNADSEEPVYKHIFPFDCKEIRDSFLKSFSANPAGASYEERRIRAFCLLAEKDFPRAERALRDLNDDVSADPDALMALVELCLLDESRREEALEMAVRGWDKFKSPAFRYIAVWAALATGNHDIAGNLLGELADTGKDDPFFENLSGAAFTWALETDDKSAAEKLSRTVIETLWKGDWNDYFGNMLRSPLGNAVYRRFWPASIQGNAVADPTGFKFEFVPRDEASSGRSSVW